MEAAYTTRPDLLQGHILTGFQPAAN